MTFEIRKSGKQPAWLSKKVYDGLCANWESDKFKEKSVLGKTNRASPLVAKELKRESTIDESFARTHSRKKDQSFVDEKSKDAYFKRRLSEIQSSTQGEGTQGDGTLLLQLSTQTQMNIWKEAVGLKKKGKIYEFGMKGSCASSTNPSTTTKVPIEVHEKEKQSKKKIKVEVESG
ncbi:hypothetical protein Cgig2_023536 [Carnegiea gigantea]|uniref:Uncharacterized protein n=1 Tax=Carnegiea gigantea TaxID=171969 RepID=A0A9Q1GWJ8_9CARY|nr:hypothetical protein Cgig2_023536 [Carnegiea gigantea]